jgi:hypothetical protein
VYCLLLHEIQVQRAQELLKQHKSTQALALIEAALHIAPTGKELKMLKVRPPTPATRLLQCMA